MGNDKRIVLSKLYAKISDNLIGRVEALEKYAISSGEYNKILTQTPESFSWGRLNEVCEQLSIETGV